MVLFTIYAGVNPPKSFSLPPNVIYMNFIHARIVFHLFMETGIPLEQYGVWRVISQICMLPTNLIWSCIEWIRKTCLRRNEHGRRTTSCATGMIELSVASALTNKDRFVSTVKIPNEPFTRVRFCLVALSIEQVDSRWRVDLFSAHTMQRLHRGASLMTPQDIPSGRCKPSFAVR